MSRHLDSNTVISIINGRRTEYREQYERLRDDGEAMFVSSLVIFELWYGVANGAQVEKSMRALRLFRDTLKGVLPFTDEEAITAGEIRATLKAGGTPIGPYDLLIAAHAVRLGATLVTSNVREFARVPGLKFEDWSR